MHRKNIIIIFIVIFASIVCIFVTKSDTKHYLNTLRKHYMESDKGEYSVSIEWNTNEEVTVSVSNVQYEVRDEGFYYKETRYDIGDGGELIPQNVTEVFEDGKRIKLNGTYEITAPDSERISLEKLLGGVWTELNRSDIKNIEEENKGPYTEYRIDFLVRGKEENAGAANNIGFIERRELVVIVDKDANEIKELRQYLEGTQNNSEQSPLFVNTKIEFR